MHRPVARSARWQRPAGSADPASTRSPLRPPTRPAPGAVLPGPGRPPPPNSPARSHHVRQRPTPDTSLQGNSLDRGTAPLIVAAHHRRLARPLPTPSSTSPTGCALATTPSPRSCDEHTTLTTDQLTAVLFTNPITCRHRLQHAAPIGFVDRFIAQPARRTQPGLLGARPAVRPVHAPWPAARARPPPGRCGNGRTASTPARRWSTCSPPTSSSSRCSRTPGSIRGTGADPVVVGAHHRRGVRSAHPPRRPRRLGRRRPQRSGSSSNWTAAPNRSAGWSTSWPRTGGCAPRAGPHTRSCSSCPAGSGNRTCTAGWPTGPNRALSIATTSPESGDRPGRAGVAAGRQRPPPARPGRPAQQPRPARPAQPRAARSRSSDPLRLLHRA